MKTTFIYKLIDPNTNEVKYIGKSDHPRKRLDYHLRTSIDTSEIKKCWINSLLRNSQKPLMEIIEEVSYNEWMEKEEYWIRHYAKTNELVNTTFVRPPSVKPPRKANPKTLMVRVGVTEEQKNFMKSLAKYYGLNMTDFILEACRHIDKTRPAFVRLPTGKASALTLA
jgi:hypothetical protein